MCQRTNCLFAAVYKLYCPVHVNGSVDTDDYREFFNEALCPGHRRGRNKLIWAESLFNRLNMFKDCKTLKEVYAIVKQHVNELGGQDPKLFLYDTTVQICRKYNIHIKDIPEQGVVTGGPKNWKDFIGEERDPYRVYKIMRVNISNQEELDTYWKFICSDTEYSNYIGDHMETLMCYFKPLKPTKKLEHNGMSVDGPNFGSSIGILNQKQITEAKTEIKFVEPIIKLKPKLRQKQTQL